MPEQRLIEANKLKDHYAWWGVTEDRRMFDAVIDAQPTVDAVEVVRCKKCKHHYWEQEPCHGRTEHFCRKLGAEVTSDFFCAAGRKKETDIERRADG